MNIVKTVDFTKGDVTDGASTSEPFTDDLLLEADYNAIDVNGHGTFVAGLIGSRNPQCTGIAPEAEIYILKLFTDDEVTYSAWFLDAFNFILDNDIDIVNLSTASKDTQDLPFIEKIEELTTHGVIVISAIGNDGPTQGSVESPGNLDSVIGVGSLSANFEKVAAFSSRGMSKSQLSTRIGSPNPDVMLPGEQIMGLDLDTGKCRLNHFEKLI